VLYGLFCMVIANSPTDESHFVDVVAVVVVASVCACACGPGMQPQGSLTLKAIFIPLLFNLTQFCNGLLCACARACMCVVTTGWQGMSNGGFCSPDQNL